MKSLERLGLRLNQPIELTELLSETFNPKLYGLSNAQYERVMALRDVVTSYMSALGSFSGKTICSSHEAVANAGAAIRYLEHEEFWVAYLNRVNTILSFEMLFRGSLDSVSFSPKEIIAKALSKRASNIIVFHNHPSGSPQPSPSDIEQTRILTKACLLMEIQFLDHIIVSSGSYYSFADEQTFKFNFK